jgi:hypothetical protein
MLDGICTSYFVSFCVFLSLPLFSLAFLDITAFWRLSIVLSI